MLYKGSLTKCVIAADTLFLKYKYLLLCIVHNPLAKYYQVEDEKGLNEIQSRTGEGHLRIIWFGSHRELRAFTNVKTQLEINFKEPVQWPEPSQDTPDESGNQETPPS